MCEEKWKRKRRKQNEKKEAESLWDVYDDVIGKPEGVDYTLVLSSSTDAQITEDGVLQVDYDGRNDTAASAAGNYDGTYTIWGIGGFSCQNGDKLIYRIRTTAGDAHIADLMSIKFFMGGTVVLESTFQQWLEDAVVEIDGAAPADKTLITDGNWHSYTMQLAGATAECQGMKIYFDRGEYSGTVYFGPVTCDKGAGTENIDDFVISGRTNSYQDPVDQFYPLIRSKAYNNGIGTGATSGCNIHNSWINWTQKIIRICPLLNTRSIIQRNVQMWTLIQSHLRSRIAVQIVERFSCRISSSRATAIR